MVYMEIFNWWVKKDSIQEWSKAAKPSKNYDDQTTFFIKDSEDLKTCIVAVERGLETLEDAVEKVFGLQNGTSTDIGKL